MRSSRFVAFAAAALFLMAGCGGNASPAPSTSGPATQDPRLDQFYNQTVTWTDCGNGFQCTAVKVPLSYDDPGGDTLSLKVNRLPAADPPGRIGSLLVEPGGPGASGVEYVTASKDAFSQDLRNVYDLVGFDPRGVGASDPIHCLDASQADRFLAVEGTPFNASQTADVVNVSTDFGKGCQQKSPKLVFNVGTVPAAKDLDILRSVVKDQKLNLLAKSYGTFMGLTYVGLFPAKVGRFALDGVIDPTLTNEQLARGQAEGFQLAQSRFIDYCIKRSSCPLPKSAKAGLARINKWLQSLAFTPIKAAPGRPLTRALAVNGLIASMYQPDTQWPALSKALAAGFKGNGGPMLAIVDTFVGRKPNGTYDSNSLDALYAVNCLDRKDRAGIAETQRQAVAFSATASTFGSDFAWANLPCSTWPVGPTDQPHVISGEGAGPILLVATTHDPATPYPWAVSTSKQMPNSTLLSWTGDGHTAYLRGSECVDSKMNAYLISGTVPEAGQTCS